MIGVELDERREPERLLIDYRLKNRADRPMFVSVRTVLRREPSRRPFTFLPFDDLVLRATYRTPPPPPGTSYFLTSPSLFCRIDARSTHTGHAELEVPVRELQPFEDPPYPDATVGIPVSDIDLEFQWILEPDVQVLKVADPDESLFVALGPPEYTGARLDLTQDVEVLRRPGPYYRF